MMGWYSGWGWAGWLTMSLIMLAFWGLLAVGVVALVRTLGREDRDRPVTPAGPRVEGARAILDGRFARGEIDADEYERRRDLLSKR